MRRVSICSFRLPASLSFQDTQPVLSLLGIPDPLQAAQKACAVAQPAIQVAKDTASAAVTASQGVIGIASTVPAVASKTMNTMSAFSDPAKLASMASAQKGGSSASTTNGEFQDYIIISGLLIIILGGIGTSIFRNIQYRKNVSSDSPPNPRTV